MKRNSQCYFDIDTEKLICQDYIDGLGGATFLKNKYGANTVSTIYNILKAYNIPRRNLSEARRIACNYSVNENSFSDLDDRETCYWLGVMYTDGYISKAGPYTNTFGISVQASDAEWLEKLKKYLNYSGELHYYKVGRTGYKPGSPYVRLQVGNNNIVENLEKAGVIEHKTKKISSIPKIKYIDDFIRGVIDGDGSLRKTSPNLRICGNKLFLEEIGKYLGLPYKIYPDKSIYDLCYGVNESRILEKRLYENAPVYLERKYQIAKRSF